MAVVMIMAGGTGGHIFPGLAVADALLGQNVTVHWMGAPDSMEERLIRQRDDIAFYSVSIKGLRGNGAKGWLLAPFRIFAATWRAFRHLRSTKTDCVLAMGGYVSGPGGLAAAMRRTPLVVHEQNSVPGMTNTGLSKLASRVLTGFDIQWRKNSEYVGNPVRSDIAALAIPEERFTERSGPIRILVLGGSQGAQKLNQTIPQAVKAVDAPLDIRHQCGERHVDGCKAAYQQASVQAQVTGFIADMADAYGWADLVICRAGALTIAELAAAGCAALLVPFPHAVDDHQTRNAQVLVDAQAATLWPENSLDAESLARYLNGLDRKRLSEAACCARALARPQATRDIAQACLKEIS